MIRRRVFGVATTVVAMLLVVASAAFACTVVQGQTVITAINGQPTNCGAPGLPRCEVEPGDEIMAAADMASRNKVYLLYFMNFRQDQHNPETMDTCMSDDPTKEEVIGGPAMAESDFTIDDTRGVIPLTAQSTDEANNLGPAIVCFMTRAQSYGTHPAELTVL